MSLKEKMLNYLAAVKEDFPAAMAMTADDVVWINLLPENVPFGGTYQGHEGLVEYFQQLATSFVIGDYPIEEFDFIETEDTLVMVGYEKDALALPTDVRFDLHFVWVVKFDAEGLICYLREHNDTAAIGAAFAA